MIFEVLSFLIVGALAGVMSGLLGIGGGIVVIPCLLLIFNIIHDVPPDYTMHLAIGTSLASMVFTTFSAARSHYKKRGIQFSILKSMGIGCALGALLGAYLATVLSSAFLALFFGSFECLIGLFFLFPERKEKHPTPLPHYTLLMTIGLIISTLSVLLGIGGGLMNVPVLTHFKVPMRRAIGTSSALSFLVALVGGIAFLSMGVTTVKAPESMGFIYLPAFIAISISAFITAPLGVYLAHRLSPSILRRSFGVVLVSAGLSILL